MIETTCKRCNKRIVSPDGKASCGLCPRGVGDTLENILSHIGGKQYKAAYKKVTGQDCGCDKRKEKLNKRFPYKTE